VSSSTSSQTQRPSPSPEAAALADGDGTFRYLALDHRDALRNAFARAGAALPDGDGVAAFKCRVLAALAPLVSGVLLDEDAVLACRPAGAKLLVPLEEQGHELVDGGRVNALMPDAAARAAALGADGCKLLLHYRADRPAAAERQRALVREAADAAAQHGLPLVLEPLVYDEPPGERFAELVVSAARELRDCGPAVLKLQFPGDASSCAALTEAAASLPWALLGGADVDGGTFAAQLEIAVGAGARGFIAGRCVWGGALIDERTLEEEAAPLLRRLSELVAP
jgi:sulfofructosephosphate aldolase